MGYTLSNNRSGRMALAKGPFKRIPLLNPSVRFHVRVTCGEIPELQWICHGKKATLVPFKVAPLPKLRPRDTASWGTQLRISSGSSFRDDEVTQPVSGLRDTESKKRPRRQKAHVVRHLVNQGEPTKTQFTRVKGSPRRKKQPRDRERPPLLPAPRSQTTREATLPARARLRAVAAG